MLFETTNEHKCWDFPAGPWVKSLPSNTEGMSLIPCQGTKIPHASQSINQSMKKKNQNRNNIVTNLIKTLKVVHVDKIFKNKEIKCKVLCHNFQLSSACSALSPQSVLPRF